MMNYGDKLLGSTFTLFWSTVDKNGGSINPTAYGTVKIYKGNSTTERSSANGITEAHVFDGITGIHSITIDTSDDADPGFWGNGKDYCVVQDGNTIDTESVNGLVGVFTLRNRLTGAVSAEL